MSCVDCRFLLLTLALSPSPDLMLIFFLNFWENFWAILLCVPFKPTLNVLVIPCPVSSYADRAIPYQSYLLSCRWMFSLNETHILIVENSFTASWKIKYSRSVPNSNPKLVPWLSHTASFKHNLTGSESLAAGNIFNLTNYHAFLRTDLSEACKSLEISTGQWGV